MPTNLYGRTFDVLERHDMGIELAIDRAGRGWANSGLGQNQIEPKLVRIFQAKILAAQSALKTRLVGQNSLLKAKKIREDRTRSSHIGPGHMGPGQIWPDFFRANNLMTQSDPNSG